ncbi:phosphoribosylamine--glycine ligase [Candidatus Bathyarchaeota archaeon]|nr:phosphoribosylamine--glycine ligase [Candidatus Bathyarchaeota archaeon]
MTKALLIGNGAREHAIAEALVRDGASLKAFMNKYNPGIVSLCKGDYRIGKLDDFKHVSSFGKDCDFAVVGPEAPLVVGIANALESSGIPVVGPKIETAQLEGSKVFARSLLDKYKVPGNIEFKTFEDMDGIDEFMDVLGLDRVVVKPDGLTGGKGVKVFGEHLHSKKDVIDYCQDIFAGNGRLIIEEKLDGEEFTLQTFVDGKDILGSPIVQDHKRAYEGDEGPNTGGMGSYSMDDHLMPFISKDDLKDALNTMHEVVISVEKETGTPYKGFLYGQFMKTRDGIKLVEFNVRFGDPEAMNVLPILETSFVEICQGIVEGNLRDVRASFRKVATVVKYLAPRGYPVNPVAGEPIEVDVGGLSSLGARFYYASVDRDEQGDIITSTSRTMGILGTGETLADAERIAEKGTSMVKGKLFHRKDIGTATLLQKRVDHVQSL